MAKLRAGDRAPEFELPGTGGRSYRLADYRGRWLALAFYPGDFTPMCTRQLCSYRDGADRLAEADVALLGISPQGLGSHERFATEHSLSHPLLADPDLVVARAYGIAVVGRTLRRSTFIVDPGGIVRHADVSLLGLGYASAEEIADRVAELRASA